MTILMPDDDQRGQGGNYPDVYKANFEPSWANENVDDSGFPMRDTTGNSNNIEVRMAEPQHQNYTGLRINMAGELLAGMRNDNRSLDRDDPLDASTVQFGMVEAEYLWRKSVAAKKLAKQAATTTAGPTSTDYEETGRRERHSDASMRLSELRRPAETRPKKKKRICEKCRFWKDEERMVYVCAVIMVFFTFMAFYTRAGHTQFAWD